MPDKMPQTAQEIYAQAILQRFSGLIFKNQKLGGTYRIAEEPLYLDEEGITGLNFVNVNSGHFVTFSIQGLSQLELSAQSQPKLTVDNNSHIPVLHPIDMEGYFPRTKSPKNPPIC